MQAWEVREQALAGMEAVRQNPALDDAGRRAGLERQAVWALGRLRDILGPDAFQDYQNRNGEWLLQWVPKSK
jgi:hypothetical protein